MDRRAAAALVASMVLGGCGGGGGSGGTPGGGDGGGVIAVPAPSPAPSPPPEPTPPSTTAIAAWGDSLTPAFAANLQLLYPERLIYNGGIAGQSSTDISARQRSGGRDTWVNIFWMGTNNPTQPALIKADIAASVAALAPGNDRFLILAVLNKARPEELRGGDVYNTIVQLNRDLAAIYPSNYLDIRAYLVSQFNPALPQDVADAQNDVIPSSLRFDEIHLNNDGSVLVAAKVKEFLDAKGW
ncbi:MAG: hypothetical protein K0Q43_2331 [Ramlibacter sp.]|jgi:lysophospholipase L1-like esterase|nr:hypothetical protein [Ramlibacter sp.]